MRKIDFKAWEILVLTGSVAVFAGSLGLYLSDYPIRRFFVSTSEEQSQTQLGVLTERQGTVRRQPLGESDFRAVDQSAKIYNFDTLVTGPDASASVELDDGSKLDLGPSTMIRLVHEAKVSLDGISRVAKVDVVSGNVTAQAKTSEIVIKSKDKVIQVKAQAKPQMVQATVAKPRDIPARYVPPKADLAVQKSVETPAPAVPVEEIPAPKLAALAEPSPTPVPTPAPLPSVIPSFAPSATPAPTPKTVLAKLQFTSPKNAARLAVPKGSKNASVPISFEWKVSPPAQKVRLTVVGSEGMAKPVSSAVYPSARGSGKAAWTAMKPGSYQAYLGTPEQRPEDAQAKVVFVVLPEFEGLETLSPLVGGSASQSNRLEGKQIKDFGITLRWKGFSGATNYKVRVLESATSDEPILEKSVGGTEFVLNRDKASNDEIYYKISALLPSGFIANSPMQNFIFNFLPPALVTPAANATVTKKGDEANILLTWQKTNFTDEYEVEVARDQAFKDVFFKKKFAENFFIFRLPEPGKYWWHVKSYSKDFSSPPSEARQFTVTQ